VYERIDEHTFIERFREMERLSTEHTTGNFTVEGLRALFEYFEGLEEVLLSEEQIELDVIAICCDYTEYANIQEAALEYDVEFSDTEDLFDWFRDQAPVIEVPDSERVIIGAF